MESAPSSNTPCATLPFGFGRLVTVLRLNSTYFFRPQGTSSSREMGSIAKAIIDVIYDIRV